MIKKRKINISRANKLWLVLFCMSLVILWACQKERQLEVNADLSEEIKGLSEWYEKQIIPTENPQAFAKMNQPAWESTKMTKKGDTLLFTTLVFGKEKITRELHATYHDGVYNGVVRQYDFGFKDSLSVGTLTLNGRLIDMGFFDGKSQYTLTALAGNRNLVLMGTETIDGGKLPEVTVPPPTNPNPPIIWIPPTNPTGPPTGPPPGPTYPPPGGSGGGGGTPTTPGSQKLTKVSDPDPCKGKTAVDSRLNNAKVNAQVKETLSKTRSTPVNGKSVEYGFETVLTNLTTFEFKNNATKSGAESNINLDTRWSSAEGFTVGYTHSHPKNGAPSPSDLFKGADVYRDWATYSLPASQKTIYADYYTSTIVTDNHVYVVTIKDPAKWGNALDLSNQQARKAANDKYQVLAEDYVRRTQLYDDTINGQLYALLNMYGDAVNIYRAPNTSGSLDFVPLEIKLGGIVIKRC